MLHRVLSAFSRTEKAEAMRPSGRREPAPALLREELEELFGDILHRA